MFRLFKHTCRIRTTPSALLFMLILLTAPTLSAWPQEGIASWYGGIFQGRKTANGEIYDTYGYTCAHKTLPFGTLLSVTNLSNSKSVKVRVNDRGPFVENRIIDLTYAAARELDMVRQGTARVRLEILKDSLPEVRFNVQIGAWRDLKNARRHKTILTEAGINPTARLGNDGITRIAMEHIPEAEVFALSQKLQALGYEKLFIYQDTKSP